MKRLRFCFPSLAPLSIRMTPSVERTVYLTLLVVSTKSVEQFFSRHAENYGTMVEVSPASVGPHREPEGDAEGSQQAMVPLWINGREEPGSSTFDVVCPHDNQTCWKAASATTEDAFQAVEAAQSAFPNWSKTKPSIRQETLLRAAQLLEGRAEDYAGFMTLEMGAESGLARYFVLALSIKMLRDIAYRISSVCGSTPTCQEDGTSAMVCKEPYGVVLGIAPWYEAWKFPCRIRLEQLIWIGTPRMSSVSALRQPPLLLETPLYSRARNWHLAATGRLERLSPTRDCRTASSISSIVGHQTRLKLSTPWLNIQRSGKWISPGAPTQDGKSAEHVAKISNLVSWSLGARTARSSYLTLTWRRLQKRALRALF